MKRAISYLWVFLLVILIGNLGANTWVWAAETDSQKIILGAMRPGTTHYAASLAASQVINENSDLNIIVQPFASAIVMTPGVQSGKIAISATVGTALWPFVYNKPTIYLPKIKQPCPDLRILMGSWRMYTAWVTRPDTGIKTISDLKGRKVFWKSKIGFENVVLAEDTLTAYGLDPEKDVNGVVGYERSYNAIIAVKQKEIDAAFVPVGGSGMAELEASTGAFLVPFPPEKVKSLERITNVPVMTMPAGYLPGMKEATPILARPFFFYSRKDLPDEIAYKFVKTVIENHQKASKTLLEAREMGKEHALPPLEAVVAPYHPGAIKYYKELGIWDNQREELQKQLLEKLSTAYGS